MYIILHYLIGVYSGPDEEAAGSEVLARVAQHHVSSVVRLEGVVH